MELTMELLGLYITISPAVRHHGITKSYTYLMELRASHIERFFGRSVGNLLHL